MYQQGSTKMQKWKILAGWRCHRFSCICEAMNICISYGFVSKLRKLRNCRGRASTSWAGQFSTTRNESFIKGMARIVMSFSMVESYSKIGLRIFCSLKHTQHSWSKNIQSIFLFGIMLFSMTKLANRCDENWMMTKWHVKISWCFL